MSRIRTLLIAIALGFAMVAFVPLKGSAQSTNNPSTTPSANEPVGSATGQPSSSAVGSAATPSQPGNPQQQTPTAGDTPNPTPNTNSAPNSVGASGSATNSTGATGSAGTADQQPVGTAGQNATAQTRHSSAGLIALIVLAVIVIIAFTTISSNRRTTNITHNRIS